MRARRVVLALGIGAGLSAIGGQAFADAAYCPDLKRVVALAATRDKFVAIAIYEKYPITTAAGLSDFIEYGPHAGVEL